MKELISIAALYKRNLRRWRSVTRERALAYLEWHVCRASVAIVKDSGRIVAAGCARPIARLEQATIPYEIDENGEMVFAENVVCKSPKFMPSLLLAIQARFPKCKKIVVHGRHGGSSLRIFDFARYFNLSRILCNT